MTPERFGEIRERSRYANGGFAGLSEQEAEELIAEVERLKDELQRAFQREDCWRNGNALLRRVEVHLVDRRKMEPRHSRENHTCPECETLAELRLARNE
jgi:hypothetical protein